MEENFSMEIISTDHYKLLRELKTMTLTSSNPHKTHKTNHQDRFTFTVFYLVMGDKFSYTIYNGTLTAQRYLKLLRSLVADFLDNLPLNERNLDGAQNLLAQGPLHCNTFLVQRKQIF